MFEHRLVIGVRSFLALFVSDNTERSLINVAVGLGELDPRGQCRSLDFEIADLKYTVFVNGAVDDETGSQIISVEAEITVFGRTLSGDAVASAPVRTRLDFSP